MSVVEPTLSGFVYFPQSPGKNAHILPGIWPPNCNSPSTAMDPGVLSLVMDLIVDNKGLLVQDVPVVY